jgi:hypothetical protein
VWTLIRHTALEQCICEHVSLKKITTVEYRKAESVFMERFWQKQALYVPAVFVKECHPAFKKYVKVTNKCQDLQCGSMVKCIT